ncbi:hypothetical protein ACQZ4R_13380 [Agrobacterium vitis]
MKENSVVFANFICRFGDAVLLDYAQEIVIPAFTDDTYIRSFGDTNYHFYETKLINLSNDIADPVLAISGRFVKNTTLTRFQIFDQQTGLIKDELSMASAPSVFFVLILNNHRLIYLPETPYAPDLSAFRLTVLDFIRRKWHAFIDETYKVAKISEQKEAGKRITKKALREKHRLPTLEIIRLTDQVSLAKFVDRYKLLKRIDFRLIRPNDELDASATLNKVRQFGLSLNATNTKIIADNPKGLDKAASAKIIANATENGNQDINLSGKDVYGNTLKGNNESFELSVDNVEPPEGLDHRSQFLFDIYKNLVDSAAIKAPALSQGMELVRRLIGLI